MFSSITWEKRGEKDLITLYFDGLCYPKNPGGVAAYGYVISCGGQQIHEGFGAVGEGRGMTNNVAEYEGLKAALQWIVYNGIEGEIVAKGDSHLVIKQMKGDWQIKSATSKKYVPEIKKLLAGRKAVFLWVPREENERADSLSRKAYEAYRRRAKA